MTVSYSKIVDASMLLRSHSREDWDVFVAAVQEHAAQVLAEILRCPPELLQRCQGMSIEASELAGVLANAPQLYEKKLQAQVGKQRTGDFHV